MEGPKQAPPLCILLVHRAELCPCTHLSPIQLRTHMEDQKQVPSPSTVRGRQAGRFPFSRRLSTRLSLHTRFVAPRQVPPLFIVREVPAVRCLCMRLTSTFVIREVFASTTTISFPDFLSSLSYMAIVAQGEETRSSSPSLFSLFSFFFLCLYSPGKTLYYVVCK